MTAVPVGVYMKPKFGHGLKVCTAAGHSYVEDVDPEGSVWDWNSKASSEVQILKGDRINSYKMKGDLERKLVTGKELQAIYDHAFILNLTKPSPRILVVKRPLGITVKKYQKDQAFFVIDDIKSGSIQKWNKEHPDKLVAVGDIISAVNGVKGTQAEVVKMLADAKNQGETKLLIFCFSR